MLRAFVLALLLCLGTAAFGADDVTITGAGATFPFPLYSKWFSEYNKLHSEVKLNYQSIGSGGGIKQITARTVDFGASDAPLSDKELLAAPGLQHIPTVLGGVVLVYNLPAAQDLKLSPATIAGIFLGKITKWNDAAIAADNAGATLPDTSISIAHRSDGSGTTDVFTDYLSKVSPEWSAGPGRGKSVKWPSGLGGKGNEGVTGLVKQAEGTVGYVELAYATQNKLQTALVKNRDGSFVKCTPDSISAAAAAGAMPADYRVSITDAKGKDAYPISSFTYLLVYSDQSDPVKGAALLDFLWWAGHDGQAMASALDYAPLPQALVGRIEATLKAMKVAGKAPLANR